MSKKETAQSNLADTIGENLDSIESETPENETGEKETPEKETQKSQDSSTPDDASPDTEGEGQGAADQERAEEGDKWFSELGYESEEEAQKSVKELHAHKTKIEQENADLKKRLETIEQQIQTKEQESQQDVDDSEIPDELRDLDEKIWKTPTGKKILKEHQELVQSKQLEQQQQNLNSEILKFAENSKEYPDFEELVPTITKMYEGMSKEQMEHYLTRPDFGLTEMYYKAKASKTPEEIKKQSEELAKQRTEEEKKKMQAANEGGNGVGGEGVKQMPDNPQEEEPFMGDIRYLVDHPPVPN